MNMLVYILNEIGGFLLKRDSFNDMNNFNMNDSNNYAESVSNLNNKNSNQNYIGIYSKKNINNFNESNNYLTHYVNPQLFITQLSNS